MYADGVLLGHSSPRSTDLIKLPGAMVNTLAELSIFSTKYLTQSTDCLFDYDGEGHCGLFELGLFSVSYLLATPGSYCGPGW